jgi:hypothetical protein
MLWKKRPFAIQKGILGEKRKKTFNFLKAMTDKKGQRKQECD